MNGCTPTPEQTQALFEACTVTAPSTPPTVLAITIALTLFVTGLLVHLMRSS